MDICISLYLSSGTCIFLVSLLYAVFLVNTNTLYMYERGSYMALQLSYEFQGHFSITIS